jgi:hypothetical protein
MRSDWTRYARNVASEVPETTHHARCEVLLTSCGKVCSGKHGNRLLLCADADGRWRRQQRSG